VTLEISHVRYAGTAKNHESIVAYKWRDDATLNVDSSNKPNMVQWIDEGGQAFVGSGSDRVKVHTVHPQFGQPYCQTKSDGKWSNNLLALPTF
jgi:Protein of unknown function (DUF3892)